MGRRESHSLCQTCRERHLKCSFKTPPCDNCAKSGRECRPSSSFLFRPVSGVGRLRGRHRRRKNNACSPSTQRQGSPSCQITLSRTLQDTLEANVFSVVIVDETNNTIQANKANNKANNPEAQPLKDGTLGLESPRSTLSADDASKSQEEKDLGTSDSPNFDPNVVWCGSSLERPLLNGNDNWSNVRNGDDEITSTASTPKIPAERDILQSIANGAELELSTNSPSEARKLQDGCHRLTPGCISALPTGPDAFHQRPFPLDNAEADLFRHFIRVWGPLIDSTDDSKQFTTFVPYLAKKESPCLMYAILALVSCQLSRTSGYSLQTSKLYRKKCAQVLVSILLSDPDSVHEASIFATYVLLRVYDHLHITATLTERRPESLFSDALALSIQPWHAYSSHAALKQASFWIHLRQDIHVALQLECTVQVDHALYEQTVAVARQITEEDAMRRHSASQHQDTNEYSLVAGDMSPGMYSPKVDCAWTNRLVGLTCQVVNYCFEPRQQSIAKWTALMAELESWNLGKPKTFEPSFEQAHDPREGHPFPTIHLLNDWHVLGLMYYHLSVILLKSHRHGQPCANKDPRAIGYDIRDDLIHHVKLLCGIAWTNPTDQAVLIVPAMLNVSACFFSDVRCQKGVLDLLDLAKKQIGAHTSTIQARLIDIWNSRSGHLAGR